MKTISFAVTKVLVIIGVLALSLMQEAQALDTLGKVLKVFDLDFDDVVIERGENWVEEYYIK